MTDRVAVIGHIFGDHRARAGAGSIADLNWSDQHRVRADEGVLADDCSLFRLAIEVAGDRTGSNVRSSTDVRVADITEVPDLDMLSNKRFLQLGVGADMHVRPDVAARANGRIGADLHMVLQRRTSNRAGFNEAVPTQMCIFQNGVGTDSRASSNDGGTPQVRTWLNDYACLNRDSGIDPGCLTVADQDARVQQPCR